MGLSTAFLRLFQRPFEQEGRLRLPDRFDPTPGRQLPALARKPFRDLWKELEGFDVEGNNPPAPAGMGAAEQPSEPAEIEQSTSGKESDLASQFATALTKAGGEVRVAPDLGGALHILGEYLEQLGVRSAVANQQPPFDTLDLAGHWPGIRWQIAQESAGKDDDAFRGFAAQADIGLSLAEAALAETGSVAVQSGPGLSRLTALLPPVHLVMVPGSCLTQDIFTWSASRQDPPPAALTLISGPSKTGDIEQTLTTGVHGPKRFIAIVYD
jgi:L-lactate dehydrogenase complex protein LldG